MARALLITVAGALDRHLDAARAGDRRGARRLIDLFPGAERMGAYSLCLDKRGRPLRRVDKTLAHRDHIHIGLSRAGARKRTSFWAL